MNVDTKKRFRKSMELESEFDHINKRLKTLVLEPPDRLSHLPNDLLHHILSFLPQDSVPIFLFLSKRFLNLWTTLPVLCFEFGPSSIETNDGLISFVQKLFYWRDKSTVIEKFCLASSGPNCCLNIARVNTLIREVVLPHGVRELDLKLENFELQIGSPFSSVSCKSLTSLKLSSVNLCTEPFPAYLSFPNLKTMHLTEVVLGTNFASQLINCPKLENLVIDICTFSGLSNQIPFSDCSLRTLPNLFSASISLKGLRGDNLALHDILRVITNVEVFSLNIQCPLRLQEQLQELGYFSKFHNLKILEFGVLIEMQRGVNYMDSMLRSLPTLESLNIGFVGYAQQLEDGRGLPNCRLSECLKVIRIGSVNPEKLLVKLVKYFLEEAKALEKMTVCKPKRLNQEELDLFCQELQVLPKCHVLELS